MVFPYWLSAGEERFRMDAPCPMHYIDRTDRLLVPYLRNAYGMTGGW